MRQMGLRLCCGGLVLLASSVVGAGSSAATAADSAWAIQPMLTPAVAPNGQLSATACPASSSCVSVGVAVDGTGRDVALIERWNGVRWVGQSVPGPADAIGTSLAGVSCTAVNACIAVGNLETASGAHVVLVDRWSGGDWQTQPAPNPAAATDSFLSAVSCASPSDCIAVGYSRDAANHKSTLTERWNGRSWAIQSTPNATGAADAVLRGVSCSAPGACTAVGASSTGLTSQAFIERWNGTAWLVQIAPLPTDAAGGTLVAVSCVTAASCTSVGNFTAKSTKAGGALAERWDGAVWTVDPTPGTTLDFLSAVACTTASSCTAVGQTGFSEPIADRWDGASWAAQTVPSPSGAEQAGLVGVACPTTLACTAIGSALYSSGDGTNLTLSEQWSGDQWVIVTSFNPMGATAFGLAGVSCPSVKACMAVGYYFDPTGARLGLAETWNGAGWTVQPMPSPAGGTEIELSSVSCATAHDCTAVGSFSDSTGVQSALAEHWSGDRWSVQPTANASTGAASTLSGVSCPSRNTCTAAGGFVDSGGVAEPLIERWNGTIWQAQPAPHPPGAAYVIFDGVSCANERSCVAVGLLIDANFTYLTFAERWDGTTWTIQTTPNPPAIDGQNGTLEGGVSCPTVRSCTAVGQWSPAPAPHPGVTLAEHWNGNDWAIQTTSNPPQVDAPDGTHNAPFAGVSCPTVNTCTAVGNYDSGNTDGDFLALAERWDGTTWTIQQAPTPTGAFYTTLHSVACPSPRLCVAVGESTRYNAQTNTRARPTALAEIEVRNGDG